jgi:hypothetical protein
VITFHVFDFIVFTSLDSDVGFTRPLFIYLCDKEGLDAAKTPAADPFKRCLTAQISTSQSNNTRKPPMLSTFYQARSCSSLPAIAQPK